MMCNWWHRLTNQKLKVIPVIRWLRQRVVTGTTFLPYYIDIHTYVYILTFKRSAYEWVSISDLWLYIQHIYTRFFFQKICTQDLPRHRLWLVFFLFNQSMVKVFPFLWPPTPSVVSSPPPPLSKSTIYISDHHGTPRSKSPTITASQIWTPYPSRIILSHIQTHISDYIHTYIHKCTYEFDLWVWFGRKTKATAVLGMMDMR